MYMLGNAVGLLRFFGFHAAIKKKTQTDNRSLAISRIFLCYFSLLFCDHEKLDLKLQRQTFDQRKSLSFTCRTMKVSRTCDTSCMKMKFDSYSRASMTCISRGGGSGVIKE